MGRITVQRSDKPASAVTGFTEALEKGAAAVSRSTAEWGQTSWGVMPILDTSTSPAPAGLGVAALAAMP
jgi:hypothetical protein